MRDIELQSPAGGNVNAKRRACAKEVTFLFLVIFSLAYLWRTGPKFQSIQLEKRKRIIDVFETTQDPVPDKNIFLCKLENSPVYSPGMTIDYEASKCLDAEALSKGSGRKCWAEAIPFTTALLKEFELDAITMQGSLLGWWRHNQSFIPWDVDGDTGLVTPQCRKMFPKYQNKYKEGTKNLGMLLQQAIDAGPEKGKYKIQNIKYGVGSTLPMDSFEGCETRELRVYKYPDKTGPNPLPACHVDIFMIWPADIDPKCKRCKADDLCLTSMCASEDMFLPTKKATLEGRPIAVPNDVEGVLNLIYRKNTALPHLKKISGNYKYGGKYYLVAGKDRFVSTTTTTTTTAADAEKTSAQRLEKIKAAAEEEEKAQREAVAAKTEKKKAEKAKKKAEKAKKEKERLIAEETAFLSAQKPPAGTAVAEAPIFTATKTSSSSPLGNLPDLDTLAKQNKENMKRAEEEFARNRKARKEKKKAKKAAMKEKANVTDEDMLRRNNLFKKHRDLFVEKKKESRTSELTHYKEKVFKPAVKAAEAAAPRPECKTETPQEPDEDDPEQQKRNAFRHILASQFKQVEAKREAKQKEENLNLTAQWQRSTHLRDTLNQQKEDAMLKEERARREQLAAFHQTIQTHGVDTSSADW